MLFTSSATFVGAFVGVCSQMYACALRKVPLFHRTFLIFLIVFVVVVVLRRGNEMNPANLLCFRCLSLSVVGLTIIRLDRTPKTLLPTTEPQLHAGFAVAGALTAEWLVQKEQSLQKDVDALVAERRERNADFASSSSSSSGALKSAFK